MRSRYAYSCAWIANKDVKVVECRYVGRCFDRCICGGILGRLDGSTVEVRV